jgi:hypothetical protein
VPLIQSLTAKRLEQVQDAMRQPSAEDYDRIIEGLSKAALLHIKLGEFAYPKLARLDIAGEAPTTPVSQRTSVTLRFRHPWREWHSDYRGRPSRTDRKWRPIPATIRASERARTGGRQWHYPRISPAAV